MFLAILYFDFIKKVKVFIIIHDYLLFLMNEHKKITYECI